MRAHKMTHHIQEIVQNPALSAGAAALGAATWLEWVTPIAGLFTIIWLGINIGIKLYQFIQWIRKK